MPLRKVAIWNNEDEPRDVSAEPRGSVFKIPVGDCLWVTLWGDEDEIQFDLTSTEIRMVIYNVEEAEVLTESEWLARRTSWKSEADGG